MSVGIYDCPVQLVKVDVDGLCYEANYYVAAGQLHISAPEVSYVTRCEGLDPYVFARLVLQRWIYEGRTSPH